VAAPVVQSEPRKSRKLSYKLQLELDTLPARLEQLEGDIAALQAQINAPDFFSQPGDVTQAKLDALAAAESSLEDAFLRWEELEAMKNGES
jgi:ATP-binding cassette subfamily F protein uup